MVNIKNTDQHYTVKILYQNYQYSYSCYYLLHNYCKYFCILILQKKFFIHYSAFKYYFRFIPQDYKSKIDFKIFLLHLLTKLKECLKE